MKEFLIEYARKKCSDLESVYNIQYKEDVNDDAINGDKWLDKGTSYIWKVGVLALIDSNKCDFVRVIIAHQRTNNHDIEIIGELYWSDGENDDIGRCLDRYLECLRCLHLVFTND
jgi:hypothetical protein